MQSTKTRKAIASYAIIAAAISMVLNTYGLFQYPMGATGGTIWNFGYFASIVLLIFALQEIAYIHD